MPGKRYNIVAFGEVLWDLLPDETILGGAPFNFINRINERGDIGTMISALGNDEFGKSALQKMKGLGIETSWTQIDKEHPTGTVEVFLDVHKNPDYNIITNVAYDYIHFDDALIPIIEQADCLCFGSLVQRNKVSARTLRRLLDYFAGTYIFYDINLRKNCYTKDIIVDSLNRANILKLNNDELVLLQKMLDLSNISDTDFIDKLIANYQLEYVLVTFGAGGVLAASNMGEKIYRPSYQVDLVDPLGSGDAFSAGFIHALLNGFSMNDACDFGNVLGGIVAMQKGATQPISETDIHKFYKNSIQNKIIPEYNDFLIT